jgi:hypothetical protein
MTGNEMDRLLEEAINALKGRSSVLEKAPKMSLIELQNNIDMKIDEITSGVLEGDELSQAKAEAQALALIKLRRRM